MLCILSSLLLKQISGTVILSDQMSISISQVEMFSGNPELGGKPAQKYFK